MATDVSMCSNALLMLGDDAIADFNEDNKRTTLCVNLYPQVRLAVLRSHPWNCAIKRDLLAPDALAPLFDFAYQYSLPSDWSRTLQIGERGCEVDHKSEGRKILANVNPLPIRFVFKNLVEATYDDMLVHGISLTMKAALAYPLTKSASLASAALKDAMDYMKTCRAVDGQDDPPETFGDFPLLQARGSDPWSWRW